MRSALNASGSADGGKVDEKEGTGRATSRGGLSDSWVKGEGESKKRKAALEERDADREKTKQKVCRGYIFKCEEGAMEDWAWHESGWP